MTKYYIHHVARIMDGKNPELFISIIVVWHKHEATQVLCAQNPALLRS